MPLKEWAKKHIHRKGPTDSIEPETNEVPSFKVYRSDSLGTPSVQIPEAPQRQSKMGVLDTSSPVISEKQDKHSSKPNRLSLLGARHRSSSQNSLPDWTPPDESDPNAERDWEARATRLARMRPISLSASHEDLADLTKLSVKDDGPSAMRKSEDGLLLPQRSGGWAPVDTVDGMSSDDALQQAIRLHESGGVSS